MNKESDTRRPGVPHEVGQFPHRVEETEHFFITLADGCRLAARLWHPVGDEQHPVPTILEYLPYRKRDGTAARDECTHPYFAGHGYACLRGPTSAATASPTA